MGNEKRRVYVLCAKEARCEHQSGKARLWGEVLPLCGAEDAECKYAWILVRLSKKVLRSFEVIEQ